MAKPPAEPCRLPPPTLQRERELSLLGFSRISGVDEVGRGPLAGPVVAAAVILPLDFECPHFAQLNDSKQLAAEVRNCLYGELIAAAEYGVAVVDVATIDTINIRQASWLAMRRAVRDLERRSRRNRGDCPRIDYVLIDGLGYGKGPWPYEPIIKGDAISLSIAAASVVAKVTRDKLMKRLHRKFPHYGFDQHKGYATEDHLRALENHGPCIHHRRTFGSVRQWWEAREPDAVDVWPSTPGVIKRQADV